MKITNDKKITMNQFYYRHLKKRMKFQEHGILANDLMHKT